MKYQAAYHLMNSERDCVTPAAKIAFAIMGNLKGRAHIGDELDSCDEDIQDEIFDAISNIVAEGLEEIHGSMNLNR